MGARDRRADREGGLTPGRELDAGWELTRTPPGACPDPAALPAAGWLPAPVPGTVAGALVDEPDVDVDAEDWWYRLRFATDRVAEGEQAILALAGVATIADVFLNGRAVHHGESMFAGARIDVSDTLDAENELAVCCRALAPRLAERRRPRARWRTGLVADANLRFHRTMLLGRAPGFAPGPAVAGIWRPVRLERGAGVVLNGPRLRPRVEGSDGVLDCVLPVRALGAALLPTTLSVRVSRAGREHVAALPVTADGAGSGTARGSVTVPGVAAWWPHTHGEPALYDVCVGEPEAPLHAARVGFRRLESAADLRADGPGLRINGVEVFCRGALWTPRNLRAPHAPVGELRAVLGRVVAAGMNMLRIPGIAAYERPEFHDLCDELGILVWQDFMFANLDYPEADPEFMAIVAAEVRSVLDALGHRPSLAVLCGGSEVAQQVAMLGLDPALAEGPLYGGLLPAAVAEAQVDAPYIPSAPWGGDVPFRTDAGVANYYGVGAYRRPIADARAAGVRFAAESLAFANVPDDEALARLAPDGVIPSPQAPAWKAGVPRDAGAGWDFDDVRDHYLRLLYDVDPVALRSIDPERYRDLSRAVSGEVMAEVFGEWRRAGSPCRGGLVLWLADHRPGAGWGVLDHRGLPKAALGHLARVLSPVAVWSTDEGLGGIDVHAANDTGEAVAARLRVALYREFEIRVDETTEDVVVPARGSLTRGVEAMLGHFVDVSWAYRFGPPAQHLVAISLESADGALLSQSFRCPAGRPGRQSSSDLGLEAGLHRRANGLELTVSSRRFVHGVRVVVAGYAAADDAFAVEPGATRTVTLAPTGEQVGQAAADGVLTALNLAGRLQLRAPEAT